MKALCIALSLWIAADTAIAAPPAAPADVPKITVSGEALVLASPDKVVLSFGIETRDARLVTAKQKNAAIWKQAAAVIQQNAIADKDVQTDHLSIEPRYKDYSQAEDPIGYAARNTFLVTLSDPAKVEALLAQMLEAGVNHVQGVEFQTTELKRHRESARQLALAAAREKAEKMAAALACTLGKPLAINEMPGGGAWYFSSWSGWGYGRGAGLSQNVVQDTRGPGGEDSPGMALGKISIRAAVSVTFELVAEKGPPK